jgi:hypothetical protein
MAIFWVRSSFVAHLAFADICTETPSIPWEILRAKSDSSASLLYNRRPMALPYPLSGGDERVAFLHARMHFPSRSAKLL